jgi:hypothetical protein
VIEIDWFAVYKEMLEADARDSTMNPADVEVLIADIIAGRIEAPKMPRSRRSRRWIAGGTAVVVLAGGATAAALLNRAEPKHPQEGIACHAAADLTTGEVVIPPAPDPLAACTQLWLVGRLPDIDHGGPATGAAPPLFACVGRGGGLDVFPNLSDPPATCTDLGLVAAITNVTADPLVVLRDRLSNDINATCVDLNTARQLAQTALSDLGLKDWTVVVRDNTKDCVKAGEDSDTKSVYLFSPPT